MRRTVLSAVAALGTLIALVGADPAPPPAQAAACTGNSGVTVVVDFSTLGGGVSVACAAGNPSTGLAALRSAGFSYEFVPRQPGFICQINSAPNPCNGAPANAHWSYWHASPGGSWSYSTSGAGTYSPPPSTVEGWSFGASTPPRASPPAQAAPPPPPPDNPPVGNPQPNVPPQGGNTPSDRQGAPQGGNPQPPAADASEDLLPSDTAPSPSVEMAEDPTYDTAIDMSADGPADDTAVTPGNHSTGSLNWTVGALLAGALGGFAYWKARRRRPSADDRTLYGTRH